MYVDHAFAMRVGQALDVTAIGKRQRALTKLVYVSWFVIYDADIHVKKYKNICALIKYTSHSILKHEYQYNIYISRTFSWIRI